MAKIVDHYRKVVTAPGLLAVGKHNAREGAYDKDGRPTAGKWSAILTHPERRQLNEVHGTGVELLQARRNRIEAADLKRKPQKNAAAAVEVVVSASPEWFEKASAKKQKLYFNSAREWIEREFGKEQVLGWAIHYDETTPHMHVLLVPLTQTKEVRKRENGKDTERTVAKVKEWAYSSSRFLGGPAGLVRLHDALASVVSVLGLDRGERGSKARHTDQHQWSAKLKAREVAVEEREKAAAAQEEVIQDYAKEVEVWLADIRPKISAELARTVERTRPELPRTIDRGGRKPGGIER